MRILIVHNTYQHRGGEDAVVEAEMALLAQHGHDVRLYARDNDEVAATGPLALSTQALWSRQTSRDLNEELGIFEPDIVHVHNTLPLISPSVYWAVAAHGIPLVQTLHNFRLLCPQAMLLRHSVVCEDCVGHLPWRAVTRRCYRDSAAQSAVVAGMLTLHRALGTWQQKITRYIALNRFCRDKFVAGGLPAHRIAIKPNFVDCPLPAPRPRDGFLFVGRLSPEKGLGVAIDAASQAGVALRVVGSGPEQALLGQAPPSVQGLGPLPGDAVLAQMASAQALVLPSICQENCPRTLVEAFASGLPVIGSRLGGLPELIRDGVNGLLFEPGNAADLSAKLAWAQAHPAEMMQMGREARATYERELSPGVNIVQLLDIYRDAIAEGVASGSAR